MTLARDGLRSEDRRRLEVRELEEVSKDSALLRPSASVPTEILQTGPERGNATHEAEEGTVYISSSRPPMHSLLCVSLV